MRNDTQAMQAQQIVQQLATLPGGRAVDVIAKKLPQLGPGGTGTPYQVDTRRFDVQQIPEQFSIPTDSDELIIRLHGSLDEPQKKDALVDNLHKMFAQADLHDHWDVRTSFKINGDPKAAYELTVFSHLPPAMPEALA